MSIVTLTTEEGTFEGQTEIEVLKTARKAKRAAKRAEAKQRGDYEHAKLLAQTNGWRAYYRALEGKRHNWELLDCTSPYFPDCRLEGAHRHYLLECAGGSAELRLYAEDQLTALAPNVFSANKAS